jgi:hypothetical protein
MNGRDDEHCGANKGAQIIAGLSFDRLLVQFHPYFEPLKELVRKLREDFIAGLDWKNHASYESFLVAFKDTEDLLPETEDAAVIYTDHLTNI